MQWELRALRCDVAYMNSSYIEVKGGAAISARGFSIGWAFSSIIALLMIQEWC
jgi:hypothetical protein